MGFVEPLGEIGARSHGEAGVMELPFVKSRGFAWELWNPADKEGARRPSESGSRLSHVVGAAFSRFGLRRIWRGIDAVRPYLPVERGKTQHQD